MRTHTHHPTIHGGREIARMEEIRQEQQSQEIEDRKARDALAKLGLPLDDDVGMTNMRQICERHGLPTEEGFVQAFRRQVILAKTRNGTGLVQQEQQRQKLNDEIIGRIVASIGTWIIAIWLIWSAISPSLNPILALFAFGAVLVAMGFGAAAILAWQDKGQL